MSWLKHHVSAALNVKIQPRTSIYDLRTFFFQYELKYSCYTEESHCVLVPLQPLISTCFYDTALAAIGRVNLASSEADALISKAHQRELLVPPGDVPTHQI